MLMKLSLIIPCYNEEASVPLFYTETVGILEKMPCDYEMVFINDGSRDKTLEILKQLASRDEHVFYVSFSRNYGNLFPREL